MGGARAARRGAPRCLLEDDVGVRPTDPERAHARDPRLVSALPLGEARVDVEGAGGKVDLRVRPLEVQAGRDLAVLQGEDGLDERGDPRRPVQVPEVGLDGADRAVAGLPRAQAERAGEGLDLDGVAERGRRAVRLHVPDLLRPHLRHRHGLGDRLGLADNARGRVARLLAAVVVHGGAPDDRVDHVAVRDRVGQPLQGHHADAVPEHRARRPLVEAAAVAVRGQDAALSVEVAARRLGVDRRPAREREVALAAQQALAGEVDRDQRRGAEGLDGEGGAGQVELVGHERGQRVAVVELPEGREAPARGAHDLGVGQQVPGQVVAEAAAGEDADAARALRRVAARRLERVPRALHEDPDLRVHHLRLARAHAEEGGVEQLHALEPRHRLHVGEALPDDGRLLREELDRLHPVAEVAPELLQVRRPRQPGVHPHDRDVVQAFGLRAHPRSPPPAGEPVRARRRRCIISSRVPARCSTSPSVTGASSAPGSAASALARSATVGAP